MAGTEGTRPINVKKWIEENKKYFLPPVCNKMMHQEGQMKSFFVGGPNQRKDFHLEVGEELFYQVKGDMVLKIVEQGKHRDVNIRQGEIFLLPGRIPHSPQRYEGTVGLVIERDRIESKNELDGLRYFVEKDGELTTESLYEEWFYCTDLGIQLGPIIKKFFASEQYKTGKPIPGTIPKTTPLEIDVKTKVEEPFSFQKWIDKHRTEIDRKGKKEIFGKPNQFQVYMYGKGENSDRCDTAEAWIWQWEGKSVVTIGDEDHVLKTNDSILVPQRSKFAVAQGAGSLALVCWQDPTRA